MSTPTDELQQQIVRGHQALLDFLRTDLDLAFTILGTAKIEQDAGNPQHMTASINTARKALESIRSLAKRIQDPAALSEVEAGAAELEAALTQFELGADPRRMGQGRGSQPHPPP
jgi:hypothetical protein